MQLKKTAVKMAAVIVISSVLIFAAGAAYYYPASPVPFGIGVSMTSGVNLYKIYALKHTVDTAETGPVKRAGLGHMFRFALTGAALLVAAIAPFADVWGAVAGVFTMQIAAAAASIGRR